MGSHTHAGSQREKWEREVKGVQTEEAGPGGREGTANTPEDLPLLQASSELPGSLWEKGNEPLPTAASLALVLSSVCFRAHRGGPTR